MEVEPSSSPSLPINYAKLVQDLGAALTSSAQLGTDVKDGDAAARTLLAETSGMDSFQWQALTDVLARRLFESAEASAQALPVVGLLVRQDHDPTKPDHLLAVSGSVYRAVQAAAKASAAEGATSAAATPTTLYVSPDLLRVWMWQTAISPSSKVHTNLLEALLGAVPLVGPDKILSPAFQILTEIWKAQLDNHGDSNSNNNNNNSNDNKKKRGSSNTSTKQQSSIVAVRCASVLVEILKKNTSMDGGGTAATLRLAEQSGATKLLEQMMNDFDDPLQQMSILDLLIQTLLLKDGDGAGAGDGGIVVPTNDNTMMDVDDTVHDDASIQEWLSSPPIMSPVLQLLGDPLLAGTAMQYLSLLSNLKPTELDTLLRHIRTLGVVTQETERLAIVQALCHVALHSSNHSRGLEEILNDSTLRRAWWDVSRISQPKLQAAILTSVALILPQVASSSSPTLAVKLYNKVGPDNTYDLAGVGNSTTQWLLQPRYVQSPMPELRIATYAILSAILAIPGGATSTVLLDGPAKDRLVELLCRERYRELTADGRVAYYELLEHFFDATKSLLADAIKSKLQKRLQLGPHGMEAQRWDVATE